MASRRETVKAEDTEANTLIVKSCDVTAAGSRHPVEICVDDKPCWTEPFGRNTEKKLSPSGDMPMLVRFHHNSSDGLCIQFVSAPGRPAYVEPFWLDEPCSGDYPGGFGCVGSSNMIDFTRQGSVLVIK